MPLVSIIVPVYNTELYLERCIGSILNQEFEDFELLLVDDGSMDRSLEICNRYAAKDARVQVLPLQHGGVSRARNAALEQARGEFVMFVDSDDEIPATCLSDCLPFDVDFVVGGLVRRTGDKEEHFLPQQTRTYGKDEKLTFLDEQLLNSIFFDGPCHKLFRKSLIDDHHLRFDERLSYAEDKLFVNTFVYHARSFRVINQPLYIQIKREGSLCSDISSGKHVRQLMDFLPPYVEVVRKLKADFPCHATSQLYHQEVVGRYVYRLLNIFKDRGSALSGKADIDFLCRLLVADSQPPARIEGKYVVLSYSIARHFGSLGLYAFVKGYDIVFRRKQH